MKAPSSVVSSFALLCALSAGALAQVKPYTVSADLHEVANLKAFERAVALTPQHRAMLAKNLFVCSPRGDEQLYWVYGKNDYADLPSFVTTDAVLQLYHVFFDSTLRKTEERALLPIVKRLTAGMLKQSVAQYNKLENPALKQAALKNVAYFGVAASELGLNPKLPAKAQEWATKDRGLIQSGKDFAIGGVFPYKLDYSQFIVRGHYTRTAKLEAYFRAMMWYGLAPFAVARKEGFRWVRADEQIRQSLLLTHALYSSKLDKDWVRVYEPTCLYVGASNDLAPSEFKAAMDRVFGAGAGAEQFAKSAKYEAFVKALDTLRKPRIQSKKRGADLPGAGLALRFMGQRYIPDSEVLQRLTGDDRVMPTGLDVMAVLGSKPAAAILDANPRIYNPNGWAEYLPERAKLVAEFAKLPEATWNSNLYYGWLYALKALILPAPAASPSFMKNRAWQEKSLSTALASWAELRHDTILYGQQSVAECGDGEEQPFVRHYVEPNVAFYDRLLALTRQSRTGLQKRGLIDKEVAGYLGRFEEMLSFLRSVAERELKGVKLARKEHDRIRKIEGELEDLTKSVILSGETFNELTEDDRDMALVADVHTGMNDALEVAVGHADDIFVIVPIEGRLTLTRGAVFSYYEFTQPISARLTDKAWRKRLAENPPPRPQWVRSFWAPERAKDRSRE